LSLRSTPVTASEPAGIYTLAWSVISDDGDTINGTIPFTRTTAATPTTTAAAPTAEGHRV
ncbi:copper resistance protein CopC, partial [Pseudonocardia sp.]|uniref:copper resistance protein CopC n=1 Tax=Pseudonocardia sp. TaxID=60912 RepID=UPI0031FBDE02